MSGLFGVNTFDIFTWVFKVPLALMLGIGASFLFFRQSLEGRLRQRRSPGTVRRESWAWALGIIGVIPCLLGAWDPGIFAIFFVAGIVVALIGRAGWTTWAMLLVCGILAAGAMALHLTYSASVNRGLHSLPRTRSQSSSGFSGSTTAPGSTTPPAGNTASPPSTGETAK